MTLVVMSEKGQVTIPREIRKKLHLAKGDPLSVDVSESGSILLRPAVVFPVEMYSQRRLEEFEREDRMTPAESKRLAKALSARKR